LNAGAGHPGQPLKQPPGARPTVGGGGAGRGLPSGGCSVTLPGGGRLRAGSRAAEVGEGCSEEAQLCVLLSLTKCGRRSLKTPCNHRPPGRRLRRRAGTF